MKIGKRNNKVWIKTSSANRSLLYCTDLINNFSKGIRINGRPAIPYLVGIYSKGHNEYWFPKSEKDKTGKLLSKNFNSLSKIKKLCRDTKKEADKIFIFCKEHKNAFFDSKLYYSMQTMMTHYQFYHFTIKYISDYWQPKECKRYLPLLEEARLYAEPVYAEVEKMVRNAVKQISRATSIPEELVACFTREELHDFFDKKVTPRREILVKRNLKTFYVSDMGQYELFTGVQARKFEEMLHKESKSKTLEGQVAFKGKVRGKVRIVLNPALCKNFKEGDILVAGMTRIDYLPLIQKSKAFITDAGGLLSHAAITARELKKPCIIGTHVATKVLQEGSIVEVDAYNGVISVIKK